jgi:hypothetical protein
MSPALLIVLLLPFFTVMASGIAYACWVIWTTREGGIP